MDTDTKARLDISRKELLDLGLRNPLINHRHRAKQVKVVDEISSEIFRVLVGEGKKMSFEALPESKVTELAERETEEGAKTESVDWEDLLAQPDEDLAEGQLADRHTDTKLQTNLVSEKLQTRLLSISRDARTYLEEQGVNILYIALGFLHWYEAPSAREARRAPLLLIPISLERASAQKRFQLYYTGEEIGDNLSLSEKLKAEFSIELPMIENGDDLDVNAYMRAVEDIIKDDCRWHVEANEITIGFFSFGKLLMYKDLDSETWAEEARGNGFSVLDSLLTEGFQESTSDFNEDTNIDDVVSPVDLHQVKDADSTQVLAILDVNAGNNLVLQGPPGTGKSQTITNIIAECIGNGKKVLFVSEKMAALDVVKRRLDEVGLGDAVIELHSHKTKKKEVLAELQRTLGQGRPVVRESEDNIKSLTSYRDYLNAYCNAISKPIGNTSINFINALGLALRAHVSGTDLQPFDFTLMASWSDSDFRAARVEVEKLEHHISEAGAPCSNPYRTSKLTEFLPSHRPRLEMLLSRGEEIAEGLWDIATELANSMGLVVPELNKEISVLCRAARRAMEAPQLKGIELSSAKWQQQEDDLSALISLGRDISRAHSEFDEKLIDEAWQQNLLDVRQQYITKGQKWWRVFSKEFRAAKARLQGLSRQPLNKDTTVVIPMLDAILDCQTKSKRFNELSDLGVSLYGAHWNGEDSDWDVLTTLTEWVVKLHLDIETGTLPSGMVNVLSGSLALDHVIRMVDKVESCLEEHHEATGQVKEFLRLSPEDNSNALDDLPLSQQVKLLRVLRDDVDSLYHIVRFNQISEDAFAKGVGFVVTTAKEWTEEKGSLIRLFDYSWFSGLVEKAYVESPPISRFDHTYHNFLLDEFSRLDQLLFRMNQINLAVKHWRSLPSLSGGGELQIIRREINKKRKHMPIRKLMSEAGRAIQAIKPIFMMSPMSIATYVPPGSVQFDLVVFDEASQVKPVDAFGAIIRGNQTVVVGDSKQLPPTSFFDSLADGGDEEDFESIADMESILSLFLGKGAHERMLRWHYRSRHDSLIAVSNFEFYDNRLVVFPSPGSNSDARGLRLHHLPDTAYDRGKTRSNPAEAKAVARAIMEHAKTQPDYTLGVVAFSTAQRDAVELQLEFLRREDPRYEQFFSESKREPFFVKNLENVQGDERDVIFISIGYGKTSEGYMSMNFGPLNRDGGERRLNVLISRARLAMDIFTNFTSEDIDTNRSNARGVIALKHFFAYAETGVLQQPYSTDREPDSPFEFEVIRALEQNGVDVEPQVGTAGFFIDIAIKDSENPGRYILGVECDGATYHSSRSARDRDRLRQEVLEGLGWRLHRIWSTEWYRNSEKELERVLAAIKQAREDHKRGAVDKIKPREVDNLPTLDRDDYVQPDDSQYSAIPYSQAIINIVLAQRELHEFRPSQLMPHILETVEQESPVHIAQIIHRITEGAGLKRAGRRIQATVKSAIRYGVNQKSIIRKGEFIWHPEKTEPQIRDRTELNTIEKKIEYVAPEEIRAALFKVVESGFSTSFDDAISNAARLFGLRRVTSQTQTIIRTQLHILIESHVLESRNGFVTVPST